MDGGGESLKVEQAAKIASDSRQTKEKRKGGTMRRDESCKGAKAEVRAGLDEIAERMGRKNIR